MSSILAIKLTERNNDSIELQKILTEYGCQIKTRIGLHHGTEDTCSPEGIIILDVAGDSNELQKRLEEFWQVKSIEFN